MKTHVILFLVMLFFLSSCATISKRRQPSQTSYSDVYDLSLGELETLLSEHLYPQHYEVKASPQPHYFETAWISGGHPFKPKELEKTSEETKYRLTFELFNVTKQEALKEGFPHQTLLRITKEVQVKKSFPKDWETESSDGLEEEALLYRVERLIKLKKEL